MFRCMSIRYRVRPAPTFSQVLRIELPRKEDRTRQCRSEPDNGSISAERGMWAALRLQGKNTVQPVPTCYRQLPPSRTGQSFRAVALRIDRCYCINLCILRLGEGVMNFGAAFHCSSVTARMAPMRNPKYLNLAAGRSSIPVRDEPALAAENPFHLFPLGAASESPEYAQ